jgi:hypothetical protein
MMKTNARMISAIFLTRVVFTWRWMVHVMMGTNVLQVTYVNKEPVFPVLRKTVMTRISALLIPAIPKREGVSILRRALTTMRAQSIFVTRTPGTVAMKMLLAMTEIFVPRMVVTLMPLIVWNVIIIHYRMGNLVEMERSVSVGFVEISSAPRFIFAT